MAIQEALAFLREARTDEQLERELEAMRQEASWESLVGLGGKAGFDFTVEELQRAHTLDWKLRRARYRG